MIQSRPFEHPKDMVIKNSTARKICICETEGASLLRPGEENAYLLGIFGVKNRLFFLKVSRASRAAK